MDVELIASLRTPSKRAVGGARPSQQTIRECIPQAGEIERGARGEVQLGAEEREVGEPAGPTRQEARLRSVIQLE